MGVELQKHEKSEVYAEEWKHQDDEMNGLRVRVITNNWKMRR